MLRPALGAGLTLRRQLTLFVPAPQRDALETWRQRLDPVQHGRIAAHVTLCREDELARHGEAAWRERVRAWWGGVLTLVWRPAERVDGHGVLLRCEAGQDAFQALRTHVLADPEARSHGAHLTLAHPRNPRSLANDDALLAVLPRFAPVRFEAVSLIEQQGDAPWQTVWTEPLSP